MANDTLLRVEDLKVYFPVHAGVLSKKIADVKAVDGISFSIERGEIFGLVGESGCGKSTTGRAILNLLKPTSGRVSYEEKVLFDSDNQIQPDRKAMLPYRRKMQMIFQDPFASLSPRRRVGESIIEGVMKHKLMDRKAALRYGKELLLRCGLHEESFTKYPHEFSGGQRQRISIARALALKPDFIIGDEPIAALDVSIQAQILMLLQELIQEFHLTFLFISHDLNVVRYFCDNLAVMYLGSIVEMGSSDSVFSKPLHPYSQALLSAIPAAEPGIEKKRIYLKGDIPSPVNPPTGCKFHTRCPKAMDICKKVRPDLEKQENGSLVACHLYTKTKELKSLGKE